jgi:succinoglycan biosynthesis protein ExoA
MDDIERMPAVAADVARVQSGTAGQHATQQASIQDSFVSIVMPCLNEAGFIAAAIRSVTPESWTGEPLPFDYEILVIDGGSSDGTTDLVMRLARENPRIRLMHNPRRLQSAAINLAAEFADPRATVLLRADSHALYPSGFVAACLSALRGNRAQSVVVTMKTVGTGCFQKAAAAAQNSMLGNGGSAHRRPGPSRFVDHGHHAAFDRAAYRQAGGYDETLRANEDVDLDMRLQRAGGKIWLETSVPMTYFPRETMRGLWRQYFHYGRGRALTYRSHRYRLKMRQLAPIVVTMGTLGGILLALALHPAFALIPLAYLLLCLGWSAISALRNRDLCIAAMGAAAAVMHHSWAFGFLTGLAMPMPRAQE